MYTSGQPFISKELFEEIQQSNPSITEVDIELIDRVFNIVSSQYVQSGKKSQLRKQINEILSDKFTYDCEYYDRLKDCIAYHYGNLF